MVFIGRKTTALVFAAAMVLAGTAKAQEVSKDIVDATVGKWLIASEDGSPGCRVTLSKDKTIGGYVLTEGSPCAAPWHEEVFSWDFSEPGIVLRDATRKKIIGFQEEEGGPWKTPLDVSPVVYFIPDPGTIDHIPVAKDAIGQWVLTDKKGKALCHIDLLDQKSTRLDDAKGAELSKDCSPSVKKTKIDAWQISGIQLAIIGGEDWIYKMMPETGGFVSDDGKFHLKREAQ
jgi:hypothetical protein